MATRSTGKAALKKNTSQHAEDHKGSDGKIHAPKPGKKTKGNGKPRGQNRVANLVSPTKIVIQPLNLGRLKLKLRGTSPLVVHNFSRKSRIEMLERQMQSGAVKSREPRCPEEEFLQAIYWVDGDPPTPHVNEETGARTYRPGEVIAALKAGTFGMPASGLKNAIISACRNTDMTMTQMHQTIFVNGFDDPDWLLIDSKKLPEMDSRICRLAGKARTPIERFRPMWKQWETTIRVEWDRGLLSEEQVVNLISIAGFFVGLCEGRPEKSSLGWGRFEVV